MLQGLPPICGREKEIAALIQRSGSESLPVPLPPLGGVRSGFACALHMHQPTVPAGPDGAFISHLQYMAEHPGEGDNHNAEPFAQCYRRMADLLPQLVAEGCEPRIMLDYSGNLLWGLQQMGRSDITDALKFLAHDATMQRCVEWLGTFWSHAVAPSTPIPDFKLQISAWQHQFLDCFGADALARVKGFSPPEMHLPNHPDTLFAFVDALLQAGYRWLLVQEHSVEQLDGSQLEHHHKYGPTQLVVRNSDGAELTITALVKTQGSDTKLVGQMQPCYEALGMQPLTIAGLQVPALVSQIADGENGGVMMNEFPEAFRVAHHKLRNQESGTLAINGTAYLQWLDHSGVSQEQFPRIQAVNTHQLWQQLGDRRGPAAVDAAIESLKSTHSGFAMEGASWTNNLSWVEGYENVLAPMNQLSARFHQQFDAALAAEPAITGTEAYRQALLHVLLLETSCFRYWGQGVWTDYARLIHERGEGILSACGG
mgnify:CR=1 FL=1